MHPIEKVFHGRNFSDGELQSARLNISGVKSKITSFLKERVEQSQADGVVFELSGDINSAVTAHLCVEALGTRRVVGMLMPDLRVTNAEDIDDAKEVASELCLEVHEFDIAPVHKTFMKNLESNRTAEGELRARIRMSLLYYKAGLQNRLVVGTVDRTEFVLGSFPKHGDGAADVLPIADLYRSDGGGSAKYSESIGGLSSRGIRDRKAGCPTPTSIRGGTRSTKYLDYGLTRV